MDQTPLKFCFNPKGSTYNNTGEKTVWCRTSGSGHEKRQCTVQLTIFADGVSHVKPLIIFKGTGQRIALNERKQYDGRVAVHFQENAWCDESIMLYWVQNMWNALNTFTTEKRSSLLIYDIHRGQTTDKVTVDKLSTEYMSKNMNAFLKGDKKQLYVLLLNVALLCLLMEVEITR